MRVRLIFRWSEFFVGLYWDVASRHLYIFPVPMLGIRLAFRFRHECSSRPLMKPCYNPASITCIPMADYVAGKIWVRDELCSECADPAGKDKCLMVFKPCPSSFGYVHVPIPKSMLYYYED